MTDNALYEISFTYIDFKVSSNKPIEDRAKKRRRRSKVKERENLWELEEQKYRSNWISQETGCTPHPHTKSCVEFQISKTMTWQINHLLTIYLSGPRIAVEFHRMKIPT